MVRLSSYIAIVRHLWLLARESGLAADKALQYRIKGSVSGSGLQAFLTNTLFFSLHAACVWSTPRMRGRKLQIGKSKKSHMHRPIAGGLRIRAD